MTQIDYLYKKKKIHSIKLIKLLLFLKRLFIKKEKNKINTSNADNLFEFLNN